MPRTRPAQVALDTLRRVRWVSWLLLAVAFFGFSYFAIQSLLVPQEHDYHGNWHGAQWITATNMHDGMGAVVYFRKSITLEAAPDNAFLTIQGYQTYSLYVNGASIDNTVGEFKKGIVYDTNLYDISPFLQAGDNVIAIRVANSDENYSAVRAVIGMTTAGHLDVYPSDATWLATADSALMNPIIGSGSPNWNSAVFNDTAWHSASIVNNLPIQDGLMPFDPSTFETPLPTNWLIAGTSNDAYYYRVVNLTEFNAAWLRIASTGDATVYVNGQEILDQPPVIPKDQTGTAPPSKVNYTTGVYRIAPYLHTGTNTIAIHVASVPQLLGNQWVNPLSPPTAQSLPAAMMMDMLLTNNGALVQHVVADTTWRATATATQGWVTGAGTGAWPLATPLDGSVISNVAFYKIPASDLPDTPDAGSQYNRYREVSFTSQTILVFWVLLAFLIFMGLGIAIQCYRNWRSETVAAAIGRMALVLSPTLALMFMFYVIGLDPIVPNPFPYSPIWLALLAGFTLATAIVIFALSRISFFQNETEAARTLLRRLTRRLPGRPAPGTLFAWLCAVAIAALGFYVISYNIGYESYWQDELASISAAMGVAQHGIPTWSTGFLYTKAELFSYVLAFFIKFFGTDPTVLRMVSCVEFVITLVLVFAIGKYFLGKRAGLIAMALMLFSPLMLWWARQARMYQQAQMFALLTIYFFYRAVQPKAKPHYIYLAMASAVAMYLSHELTFIVLAPMLVYFLWTQRLTWIRNRHWWIAGLSAIACIAVQLAAWRLTRRPVLGTDHSVLPLIHFSPNSLRYYSRLLFSTNGVYSGSLVNFATLTWLCIIGALIGVVTHHKQLRYLALFQFGSLAVLFFFLSVLNDRYLVPTLPLFAFLAAGAVVWFADAVGRLARDRLRPTAAQALSSAVMLLFAVAVIVSMIPSPAGVSLAVSRAFGMPYHKVKPDYRSAGEYVLAHWQPGDALIGLAPIGDVDFYSQNPDYKLYQDKVLTIFEYQGHVSDNRSYDIELFNEKDFDQVLLKYHRVWIFAASGYTCCVGNSGITPITQNFRLVFEGQGTFIYLHTG
ncbi:MAG: Beta-galactosidase [Ktedonobacterales bacterium]|nr:MAG: Beta-galactosidase [Ktedonobacterales bacterium]